MYEEEMLKEIRTMNERLARIEYLLLHSRDYGGCTFSDCMTRIMYGVED